MEPQSEMRTPGPPPHDSTDAPTPQNAASLPLRNEPRDLSWILIGGQGLRAGWAALLFVALYYLILPVLDTIAISIDPALALNDYAPATVFIAELLPVLAILCAGLFLSRIEHRHFLDYNLAGPRRIFNFVTGLCTGFGALSFLIGALSLGGWLHFSPAALTTAQALKYGAIWAIAFLLVGCAEEGSFRCFLQFTLTRGINFWWALATVSATCLVVSLRPQSSGANGAYCAAALGLIPCWLLHRAKAEGAGFWQAAWATSMVFGSYHTVNHGETSVGIFAAALIGFVFCISVRVTGSAWWAIGCHAAWDWAETFFYGTADSGFPAQHHFLNVTASGNPLWNGGADGPEGSLLVVPVTLLLAALLLVVYKRNPPYTQLEPAANRLAG
jgi:uncharacterized protein